MGPNEYMGAVSLLESSQSILSKMRPNRTWSLRSPGLKQLPQVIRETG